MQLHVRIPTEQGYLNASTFRLSATPLEAQGCSRDDSFHRRSACCGSTGRRCAVAQG